MRKYNIFLLFVILFLSSSRLNIIAVDLDARRYSGYSIYNEQDSYVSVNESYLEEYEEFLASEKIKKSSYGMRSIESRTLGVVRLAQSNYSGCIPSYGCAIVSVTMFSNYVNNESLSPNYVLTLNGNSCSVNWSNLGSSLNIGSVTAQSNSNWNTLLSIVKFNINNSRPVIVGLERTINGTRNTHYIVASGYWISGTNSVIYIKDPGGNNRTSLIQFINDGWTLMNYRVYS